MTKPTFRISEDRNHIEMIEEDGTVHQFDKVSEEDMDRIVAILNGTDEDAT